MDFGSKSDQETGDKDTLWQRAEPRDSEIKFVSDLISGKQFTVLINWGYSNITGG